MPMHRTGSKVLDMPEECLASSVQTAVDVNMRLAKRIRNVIPQYVEDGNLLQLDTDVLTSPIEADIPRHIRAMDT
eukprot:3910332-Pyramimonas_sp.AAC.1